MCESRYASKLSDTSYIKEDHSKYTSRHRNGTDSRSKDVVEKIRDRSSTKKSDRRDVNKREYDSSRELDDTRPHRERSRHKKNSEVMSFSNKENSDDKIPKRFYRNGEPRPLSPELSPEERDARTVFVWQLSDRIRQRELEDFFASVGKIRDIRLIMDGKSRRSKGIAYVEFQDVRSVQAAVDLSGTRLLGVPIQIQHSNSERSILNRDFSDDRSSAPSRGPTKLYVGSLHYNITEDMLRGIFEPFGKLVSVKLIKDDTTNRSQGYGFVTYVNGEHARKALDQLNGFELAGRPMKINYVSERTDYGRLNALDNEETDRIGIDLGTTRRLALMAKLAEGTGLEMPKSALAQLQVLQGNPTLGSAGNTSSASATAPPVCTQCFMLSGMFDPRTATHKTFEEIYDDVVDECLKFGGVLHLFVDRTSAQGNVYAKCPSIAIATQCVNMLHGRYFSGNIVTAAFIPVVNYHQLFPDSVKCKTILQPTS